MKKATIIGANSNLARNLIHLLKTSKVDWQCHLYDYQEEQIDGLINYNMVNIANIDEVKKIEFDVDYIFLFSAKTGTIEGFKKYIDFINVNEVSLLNILEVYVSKKSTAKIIFPSTRLVYKGNDLPLSETSEKEFKTVYALNKYCCEKYLEMYRNFYGINYCILRICVPYGSMLSNAKSYGTIEFMLSKAKNGQNINLYNYGKMKRTIISIVDLCQVLINVAHNDLCINEIYNIGGETYSLQEMANLIAEKYSVSVNNIEWDINAKKIETGNTIFNDSKLNQIINYTLQVKFEQWINNFESECVE